MEESPDVLTISELLHRGRAFTATSSLRSSSGFSVGHSSSSLHHLGDKRRPKPSRKPFLHPNGTNPSSKFLEPLNRAAILIGTVTLPSESLQCPHKSCFQFSDGLSACICCDVLDFQVQLVGTRIHVLAWNFLPFRHGNDGFLEIIRWKFPDSGSVLSPCSSLDPLRLCFSSSSSSSLPCHPPEEWNSKACYRVHGLIESITPLSVVPCSIGANKLQKLPGFIAHIMVCQCRLCSCTEVAKIFENSGRGQDCHHFTEGKFVYFWGSASRWHPVITKLVGCVIMLLGLKKKLIQISKEESQLMFVTAENSTLHLPRVCKKWMPFSGNAFRGKGDSGVYTGTIREIYMQGMVMELDKEVWLLLTDHFLTLPHSLRVGTNISVINAHFVNPKFPWTKLLILGTCIKSNIIVESFSPLDTRCLKLSQSYSQLGMFIESLRFSVKFWALITVACFQKKFSGVLSEKEILGSKNADLCSVVLTEERGGADVYQLTRTTFRVSASGKWCKEFSEFCKHYANGCGKEQYIDNLRLVVPLSILFHRCEVLWTKSQFQLETDCHVSSVLSRSGIFPIQSTSCQSWRRVLSSEDIGFTLLGNLKISSASGRLQLVDATGSIDVIVPDLPSTWNAKNIYKVVNYSIIIEGKPNSVCQPGFLDQEALSCGHIFHSTPASETNLTVYAYFRFKNVSCQNVSFCASYNNDATVELWCGNFHVLLVTHKHPLPRKFQDVPVLSDGAATFAEAIVLPWELFVSGKDESQHSKNHDCLKTDGYGRSHGESMPYKKYKPDSTSSLSDASVTVDNPRYGGSGLSSLSPSVSVRDSSNLICRNLISPEILSTATIRTTNGETLVIPGKLFCTQCIVKKQVGHKSRTQKILLEFDSANIHKYQLLQIGVYYIIKHHPEESLCACKGFSNFDSGKVHVNSSIHLWSLSFSDDDGVPSYILSERLSQNDQTSSNADSPAGDNIELHLQNSTFSSSEFWADVCLHLPSTVIRVLKAKHKEIIGVSSEAIVKDKNFGDSSGTCSGLSESSNIFPVGSLLSVCGYVIAIHGLDCSCPQFNSNSEVMDDIGRARVFQGNKHIVHMLVLVDDQMMSIFGSVQSHPVGFGPGVNASFFRVLKLKEAYRLMLTPVSFIVVNSIRASTELNIDKSLHNPVMKTLPTVSSLDNVSFRMLSELHQLPDSKPVKFNCRVVSIPLLVLEKRRKHGHTQANFQSVTDFLDIPIAGFLLDDGSSSCFCWADGERAASILRIHEKLHLRALGGYSLKWIANGSVNSKMYHLERIIKKHNRVTVKNLGAMADFSNQEVTVSVNSDIPLSAFDENLLKFVVFNACFHTTLAVVGSLMDANTITMFEMEHLMNTSLTIPPVENIWASEVCYPNTLSDARNLMQELILDR
ncbi:CST complex subunit CTC1 [Linum perenne]